MIVWGVGLVCLAMIAAGSVGVIWLASSAPVETLKCAPEIGRTGWVVAAALVLGVVPAVAEIPFVRRWMPYPALFVGGAVAVCAWFGLAALFAALLFWFVHPTASEAEILARLGVIAVSLLPATALAVSALIALMTRGKTWSNAVWIGVSTVALTGVSAVALGVAGTAAAGPC